VGQGRGDRIQREAGRVRTACSCLALLLLLVAGCRDKEMVGPAPTLPDQVIEAFTLHESSSGERLYTLEAQRAYVYDAAQRVDVTGLRVLFYDDAGGVHSTLVADEGSIYQKNEDLVARRNVVVRTADSTVLRTDSLGWSNLMQVVRTDADVVIETPRGRIQGKGLASDAGLERVDILSPVKGSSDYDFETGE
jgi:LPS export ABC transporter protein LptC